MNSANGQVSTDKIADVLESVRKKGVTLWSENGQLHYRAPKGAITQEEIDRLRASRRQIVTLLERASGVDNVEPICKPRPRRDRAPLALSQLAHWHLYRLSERPAIRQIASATRLRGQLNVDALRKSIAEIVNRHESLRTRIVVLHGVPTQEISESSDCELRVHDLTTTSEGLREARVIRIIENHIVEPIDPSVGPLFGIRLVRIREDEHVLIMALEHMISDLFSLNILLRDLLIAYAQVLGGDAISLPAIPMQFADYAAWQRSAEESWVEKHGAYWRDRLVGCQPLKFPEDSGAPTKTLSGWGTVSFRIGKNLKAELDEWCRLKRTTLVMGVFTAYVGLVLRWCSVSEGVIRYQSDGRFSSKIANAIGYFASVLYVRVALLDNDTFGDLMRRVTEEYCRAHEHADFCYMEAQIPRAEFTRNAVFNWVPQGAKINLPGLAGSADDIAWSSVAFVDPMLKKLDVDSEPGAILYEVDDEIVGHIHFPLNRFSVPTMDRFARNSLLFIEALLSQPQRRVKDIPLV